MSPRRATAPQLEGSGPWLIAYNGDATGGRVIVGEDAQDEFEQLVKDAKTHTDGNVDVTAIPFSLITAAQLLLQGCRDAMPLVSSFRAGSRAELRQRLEHAIAIAEGRAS